MTAVLLFIKNYYKYIAVALVVTGIGFYWYHLTSTIADQRLTISELTTANEILKDNNTKLTTAIAGTNASIQALSDGADKTKEDFASLSATVSSQIASLNPKLDAIRKGAKPQTCPDTMKYLLDARKEYPQ